MKKPDPVWVVWIKANNPYDRDIIDIIPLLLKDKKLVNHYKECGIAHSVTKVEYKELK